MMHGLASLWRWQLCAAVDRQTVELVKHTAKASAIGLRTAGLLYSPTPSATKKEKG
jgi:hypothetical protein